jgi:hypothetical protein
MWQAQQRRHRDGQRWVLQAAQGSLICVGGRSGPKHICSAAAPSATLRALDTIHISHLVCCSVVAQSGVSTPLCNWMPAHREPWHHVLAPASKIPLDFPKQPPRRPHPCHTTRTLGSDHQHWLAGGVRVLNNACSTPQRAKQLAHSRSINSQHSRNKQILSSRTTTPRVK